MPKIAIVDDRAEIRDTLQRRISLLLPYEKQGWECCALHPFDKLTDYLRLLDEDDDGVAVVVVDERLHEGQSKGNTNVDYSGTQLAEFLRRHKPEFPIFMITSHKDDVSEKSGGLFEELLDREDFRKNAEVHVQRMVRSGQRFANVFEKELNDLSRTAAAVARQKAKPSDVLRLKALSQKMNIAFEAEALGSRAAWLEKLNEAVQSLSQVSEKLEAELKPRKKRAR